MAIITVLLTILKVLGIVIGGIIGLILLLLLFILLAPIKYRGRIKFDGSPDITVWVTYLLRIVRFSFIMKGKEIKKSLKIFFIDLFREKKDKKTSKKSKPPKKSRSTAVKETVHKERKPLSEKPITAANQSKSEKAADKASEPDENNEPKPNIFKRVSNTVKNIYNKIRSKFLDLQSKYEIYVDKRDRIMEEINNPDNHEAVTFALNILKKVLRHILPKKHRIYLKFGTGDPASTGEILGIMFAFGAVLGINLAIDPDFENKVIEADVPFKGRISVLYIAIIALKVYRHKKLRALINKIQEL